jgi:metal-sulfur cluster biosynthetic enzyme
VSPGWETSTVPETLATPPTAATGPAAAPGTPVGLGRLLDLEDDPAPVWEALRGVIDPELGINLVDLGLVYEVAVNDGIAYITMTVTTPACPIGSYLEDQVRWAVLRLPGILGTEVEVVHEPRWTPALMSHAARKTLGWAG